MCVKDERRTIVYDEKLQLEAYRFTGVAQPFPNHFHAYYVIGLMEGGTRQLHCKNQEYTLRQGDILLLNPGDSHACAPCGAGLLEYRALNVSVRTMAVCTEALTGRRDLPRFAVNVVRDEEAADCLRTLHDRLLRKNSGPDRAEAWRRLGHLLQNYARPSESPAPECRAEVEAACDFMRQHFAEHITLEQICAHANLSKSTLLRAFIKEKGVAPYSWLENIRIGEARRLLEAGVPPVEAALRTGFSDQSHFTNCFSRFIGLPPGSYRDIYMQGGDGNER